MSAVASPRRLRPLRELATRVGLALVVATWPGAQAGADQVSPSVSEAPLLLYSLQQLQRLRTSGEMVSRENISRYFARYPMATEQGEAERVLRTVERITRGFAEKLYRAADDRARQSHAVGIQRQHVQEAVERLLPGQDTEFKTVVFFPTAPPEERIEVELIDLEAFRDTPFPWVALVTLASSETARIADSLPLQGEAAEPLARAVSDFGLLVLRLGGTLARQNYAIELSSPHLREAEKALVHRSAGEQAGTAASPDERPGAPRAPPANTRFVDITAQSGISFRHVSSDWISRFRRYGTFAPTFSGGGVAAEDLDGDHWPDLIYCGGGGCAVFRNRLDGTFEDVSSRSGLQIPGEARMPLIVDFDNDGDQDVFITYARDTNRLFENLGQLRFRDTTSASGLERVGEIGGPVVAVDYDNDGLLDIYVGNFGDYLDEATPWLAVDNQNAQANRLYRNKGGLQFEDVTQATAVGNSGWAQAISHVDYDRDGDQDIYIANDFGTNDLLENMGGATFRSQGAATGTDSPFHGMNVAFTDLNRDTYPDIFMTNIWGWLLTEPEPGEFNDLLLSVPYPDGRVEYESDRNLIPELVSHDTGWSWAGLFFDADNDGDDDLYLVNGHSDYSTFVQYRPHPSRAGEIYPINNGREKNVFFQNEKGVLKIPAEASGAELRDFNSRSIALLDYDRDGDLDLAVTTFHSQARLFRNDGAPPANHWLVIHLEGDPARGSSRDAIGAQLIARNADGLYVWRTITGGEGYLGMNTHAVELGLGASTAVDLEVFWPGMVRQEFKNVQGDRIIRIRQGRPEIETLFRPDRGR